MASAWFFTLILALFVFKAECYVSNGGSRPSLKIIQGGYNSTYAVLEFNPWVTPNTLKVVNYLDTSEGNFKPWLSRHPSNPNLILGCNDHAAPNATGFMTSYALDASTGRLDAIDVVDTGGFPVPDLGVATAHCAFFQDGQVVAAANYFGQSAATFKFDSDTGKFGAQLNKDAKDTKPGLLEFPGYTPKPDQIGVAGQYNTSQATSHPHQIVTHPFLPVMYLPDLGEDLLRVYSISGDGSGSLKNLTQYSMPPGSGPRHVAISSDGHRMYVLFELAAKLRVMKVNQTTGELEKIQDDLPIYPGNVTFSLNISAAEVYPSNDGRFVYASMRNLTAADLIQPDDPSDTIAVWAVAPGTGCLSSVQHVMVPGARQIRSFELSPARTSSSMGGQDFIVAGGLKTNNTFVFRRDRATGKLSLAASTGGTYQPATYLWI